MKIKQKRKSQVKLLNKREENDQNKPLLDYYGFTKEDIKNYPVVSGILKSITPEVRKREIEKINRVKLPGELQKWVEEYKRVGGERDDFFWSWIYKAILETTFPIITKKYKISIYKNEFLMVMFISSATCGEYHRRNHLRIQDASFTDVKD